MLEKIAIFILFLGPLVFFHELGHYLFARFFGVRVEVFSIGFGPKIIKFKKGFTEYAFSLIPLGGYVKMFGDDPLNKDAIPEAQRKISFVFKSKWARFWIVFGGPLANFLLAYAIFFTLFMTGEKVPEIKLGTVKKETSFYSKGFRSGDVIRKVNGRAVSSPSDIVLDSGKEIKTITVNRLSKDVTLTISQDPEEFFKDLGNYPPDLSKPIVKSINGKSYAISLSEKDVKWDISLEEYYHHPAKSYFLHELFELKENEEAKVDFSKKPLVFNLKSNLRDDLFSSNYYRIDLAVKGINMKTPADKAGIKAGDIIISADSKPVTDFTTLRGIVQDSGKDGIALEILRDGKKKKLTLIPEEKVISGNKVKMIGVYSAGRYLVGKYVKTKPLSFMAAITRSFSRTFETIVKTVDGFKKLITAQVSVKNIGGPLTIGKVASDSFNISMSYFFQLMALISVNLGVINLFPIPVLDGGHILFIVLEMINGGPVSRRKLEIAQQFGLSILLLLMIGALFNDFMRFS